MSWQKLLADKRDLEKLIEGIKQQLTRVEDEVKNSASLRDQVYLLEERKRLETRLEIGKQKLEEVEAELQKLRAEVAKNKAAIKSGVEKAVKDAETGFSELYAKLNELIKLLEDFGEIEANFVNSVSAARHASEILVEPLTPTTKINDSLFTTLRNLRRDLLSYRSELKVYS
jgi:chromosome segregation ATPase